MPLSPEYGWEETIEGVTIRVKLIGAVKGKPSVFATDCCVKINSAPYLLLLDLYKEVDEVHSTATVDDSGVVFRLKKVVPELWGRLTYDGEKQAAEDRRNASIDKAHQRLQEASKQRLARKEQEARDATERQLALDKQRRQAIEAAKAAELEAERAKLAGWQDALRARMEGGADSDGSDEDEPGQRAMPDHPDYHGTGWKAGSRPTELAGSGNGSSTSRTGVRVKPDSDCEGEKKQEPTAPSAAAGSDGQIGVGHEEPVREVVTFRPPPPPRERLEAVKVEFTKLETPNLPAREQREAEIKDYKKRELSQKLLEDSTGMADRTPAFLKDKGDALFKQGNYRGAINAYSRALEIEDSLAAVWSNMAACHMQLGDHVAAAMGCTRALELMEARKQLLSSGGWEEEDVQAFKKLLVRTLSRRAAAFCKLKRLEEAAEDLREGLRFDNGNGGLRHDLEEVEAALLPADASALRKRGDARFKSGDHEGAAAAYSLLLQMDRGGVPAADWTAAVANRSACWLLLGRFAEAAADCELALTMLLGTQDVAAEQVLGMVSGTEDAAKLRSAVRLLTRRGAARGYLKQFEAAAADFQAGAQLLRSAGADDQAAQVEADLAALLEAASGHLTGPNAPPGAAPLGTAPLGTASLGTACDKAPGTSCGTAEREASCAGAAAGDCSGGEADSALGTPEPAVGHGSQRVQEAACREAAHATDAAGTAGSPPSPADDDLKIHAATTHVLSSSTAGVIHAQQESTDDDLRVPASHVDAAITIGPAEAACSPATGCGKSPGCHGQGAVGDDIGKVDVGFVTI